MAGVVRLTGKIIVLLVFLVQHCRRYVWNVTTRIAFAGHVNLVVFDAKGLLKILEEFDEVLGNIFLGLGGNFANRKACANGLLYPNSEVNHFDTMF